MLHVIALGQYAVAYTRSWAVSGRIARVRPKAENDELQQHVTLLALEIIHLVLEPIILMMGARAGWIKFCLYKHLRFGLFSGAFAAARHISCPCSHPHALPNNDPPTGRPHPARNQACASGKRV